MFGHLRGSSATCKLSYHCSKKCPRVAAFLLGVFLNPPNSYTLQYPNGTFVVLNKIRTSQPMQTNSDCTQLSQILQNHSKTASPKRTTPDRPDFHFEAECVVFNRVQRFENKDLTYFICSSAMGMIV